MSNTRYLSKALFWREFWRAQARPAAAAVGAMLKNRPEARPAASRLLAGELFSAESSRAQLSVLRGMNALERHRHFLQQCPHLSGGSAAARGAAERSDLDVVRDEHRFLWDRAAEKAPLTWEQRLARASELDEAKRHLCKGILLLEGTAKIRKHLPI